MNYKRLKKKLAFGRMCRQCVNEYCELNLKSTDCYYLPYPGECRNCGEVRNIVADVRWFSCWKIILPRFKPQQKNQ